jgi:hypothetical protein
LRSGDAPLEDPAVCNIRLRSRTKTVYVGTFAEKKVAWGLAGTGRMLDLGLNPHKIRP